MHTYIADTSKLRLPVGSGVQLKWYPQSNLKCKKPIINTLYWWIPSIIPLHQNTIKIFKGNPQLKGTRKIIILPAQDDNNRYSMW